MMRGSSGRNGSAMALEPTAMIALSKPIVVSPSAVATSSTWSEANSAAPCTTVTLRCLARPASPPVSRSTTESFHAPQRGEVDLRLAERDAVLGHLLGLADDLRRVQQRLGRDAADVQADAAERA